MVDLPAGVTRYRLQGGGHTPWKADLLQVGLALVAPFGLGVGMGLLGFDTDPVKVAVVAAVNALVLPASYAVGSYARLTLAVVALVASLAWAANGRPASLGYVLVAIGGITLGIVLLAAVQYRRWWVRRLALAEGAPPSGLDPRYDTNVGRLALWQDAEYEFEMVDPTPAVVLDAVRALNGGYRSAVSLFDGRRRLDVGGDAHSHLVVQQTDDRRHWHQVADAEAPPTAPDLHVGYAKTTLVYPASRLTRLPEAETAVTTFLEDGSRAASLTWRDDTAWDNVLRPQELKRTD